MRSKKGRRGLELHQQLGNDFIHSQPSSPGCILKDIVHFG